jgi:hypothetical protein
LGLNDSKPGSLLLAEAGSAERWQQLQRLRRGRLPVEPLLDALASGALALQSDLLAALIGRLDRTGVERLLAASAGLDPAPSLDLACQELSQQAGLPAVREAWLEPLLGCPPRLPWLELLGQFRDPRVARQLRQRVLAATSGAADGESSTVARLLPLLGQQRQPEDAALLLRLASEPGPLLWRRAALEGLAVGLAAWPLASLCRGLQGLATDLDPALAAGAVDLLARLPDGQRQLRQLGAQALDPAVRARLQRRLQATPLVLVVHGRKGGEIPVVLRELAAQLAQRRSAPVLLQALTAEAPEADRRFWWIAQRAGSITLVPLLLLPGEHVRRDLPAIAAAWRRQAFGRASVRRRPFLGAWPAWQRLLAMHWQAAAAGGGLVWLHHPLNGELSRRYLSHLARVVAAPGLPADPQQLPAALAGLGDRLRPPLRLAPLTLAPNRLSESLTMDPTPRLAELLPPLLEQSVVRDALLAWLEALP